MGFFSASLILFDCVTGSHRVVDKTPFTIGSGEDCDWQIDGDDISEEHCEILSKGGAFYLLPCNGTHVLQLDGEEDPGGELALGIDHTLSIGRHLLALHGSTKAKKWLSGMNHTEWFIYDRTDQCKHGPVAFRDLGDAVERYAARRRDILLLCQGLTTIGFHPDQVLTPALVPPPLPSTAPPMPRSTDRAPAPPPMQIDMEYGEFTCPVCWLKFDRGDTMNIAVHSSLRGDPLLGEEHLQRFHATRFNDRGQAVDAMNIAAPDLACPHCRRKLPPGFLDLPHLIFSIVGAPTSGKSYYLSVLIKMLQTALIQEFGVTFRDADPSANVMLNQMKTQLFSASTPEQAYLIKTQLGAAMYESLPRLGRTVKLPKPFIFKLSNSRDSAQDSSIVFYDNAGEHFEPTRDNADSPGAQHVAAASGIFFLFDPLSNVEFKKRLTGLQDPQVKSLPMDQQDIILAEMEVRLKSLLGLDSRQKIATPLAFIVGKSDAWIHLLGEPIERPVHDGRLDLAIVKRNSARIRQLLMQVCPPVVANAEAISSEIMFFAASPLGSASVEFTNARGVKMIGPDPQKLNPQQVEIPTLWVLSRIAPAIVPSA
jgi:hypothetical protein